MRFPKMTGKWSFFKKNSLVTVGGLVLMSLWICLGGRSVNGAESAPDWLTAAGRIEIGSFGNGRAAVVLGDWTDFTVDATGKFVMSERRALRVLDRRSADPFLAAEGEENTDAKVTSIKTWTVAPSGRVTTAGKKDLVTFAGFTAFEEFTDVRKKLINPPNAEDGSLIGSEVIT